MKDKIELATLAGGCFWCTEAIFEQIRGVEKVVSGYTGGKVENPSYEDVSSGETGHAEAIQITFDPKIVSYRDLLYIFLRTHDPTTKDRQGTDVGTQYRSMIFYHNDSQKKEAEEALKEAQSMYPSEIVTQVVPFENFYEGEDYHQDFYKSNPEKTYCRLVIDPKIQKLKKEFGKYLKT